MNGGWVIARNTVAVISRSLGISLCSIHIQGCRFTWKVIPVSGSCKYCCSSLCCWSPKILSDRFVLSTWHDRWNAQLKLTSLCQTNKMSESSSIKTCSSGGGGDCEDFSSEVIIFEGYAKFRDNKKVRAQLYCLLILHDFLCHKHSCLHA